MPNATALKERMRKVGITQADLAKEVNLATPTICQKINNIRPFTLEEAERVAKKLGISDKEFGLYFFN